MRRIAIVGAGQGGLQLGLCLLARGYDVTVMSARTPEAIRNGPVTSTQVLFGPALALERRHGLNLWEEQAPRIPGLRFTLVDPPGRPALRFAGPWDEYAQSVDQRVKMAGWLELFAWRGGRIIELDATRDDLERLTECHDLTIVAAGRGAFAGLFEREHERSPFDRPQRALSCIYLRGVAPMADDPRGGVAISVVPGVGEMFSIPGYTTSGPCHIVLVEGVPGGPFDCWSDRPAPGAHLERLLALMREYTPWEYERCMDAEPTDSRCTLVGGYAPEVRHPVARLSGGAVPGMADAVVLNDPIAGQGANNAARCAEIYLRSILERGNRPFDAGWMQRTFDEYWSYAGHATRVSNALLGPVPGHVQRALNAAAHNEVVARRFVRGYAEPADFTDWIMDPAACEAYLASVMETAIA